MMKIHTQKTGTGTESTITICKLSIEEVREAILDYLEARGHSPSGDVSFETRYYYSNDGYGTHVGPFPSFEGAEAELLEHSTTAPKEASM